MDVTHSVDSLTHVFDTVGQRCQKLFQDFLEEWREDGDLKYLALCKDLAKPERNTLLVSMRDVDAFNETLARLIHDEYFRLQPFLCTALAHFMKDRLEVNIDKDYYVAFTDVDASEPLRHLSSLKIGQLVRVSGQVVRTHPVHPELVSATFTCMDCQTVICDVEQQFRYTQPSVCRNPVCNNRSRFVLDVNKSRFVDFQKVRIQEVQSELPRGAIPRTLEVICSLLIGPICVY
jgi:DNA replication licensing factor MCM6